MIRLSPTRLAGLLVAALAFLALLVIDPSALVYLSYSCAVGRCGRPPQIITIAILLTVGALLLWAFTRKPRPAAKPATTRRRKPAPRAGAGSRKRSAGRR
jgi:hypothetical protein